MKRRDMCEQRGGTVVRLRGSSRVAFAGVPAFAGKTSDVWPSCNLVACPANLPACLPETH